MSVFILKIVATICMIIDHSTAVAGKIMPVNYELYMLLRSVGRIAFPIYGYLIVNGYRHTRSKKKYCKNMFIFALIAQVPFTIALHFKSVWSLDNIFAMFDFTQLNVFFTLGIAIYILYVLEEIKGFKNPKLKEYGVALPLLAMAFVFIVDGFLGIRFTTDYAFWGIGLIMVLYCCKEKWQSALVILLWGVLLYGNLPNILGVGVAATMICFYNGKKGYPMKWFFYAIYPLHLSILAIILVICILS